MIEIMMTYKPSPRPSYSMPTHIEYNNMKIHKWGDEEAGYVDDWIYISNEKLHQIIFGLKPHGCFKHSKEFRTIFGADELLYILSGIFVISNPETGETHKVLPGDSIFFRKDTWHHGFNFSDEYLQVLEFFSPPPSLGTSGVYAKTKPYIENIEYSIESRLNNWLLNSNATNKNKSFTIIKEKDYLWSSDEKNRRIFETTLANTDNLFVKKISISPNQTSQEIDLEIERSLLVISGNIEIYVYFDNKEEKFILSEKDGFYLPKKVRHKFINPSNKKVSLIVCEAKN